jgi:hypothetical protein
MSTSVPLRVSTAPYPGLRSFLNTEADIFFGREEHTDQLLKKLQATHFLPVIGPSGCGKSSLVRAGMISALSAGILTRSGASWRIAEMRPGDRPLTRLAEALTSPLALGPEIGTEPECTAFLQAMLRRGPLGLLEALRETPLPKHANLLILVDQFEEIFRFRREGDPEEADAFVALLLATAKHARLAELPIYVVITMRSEYLGDSALFADLPETINDSQFLTPRMKREECEAAIMKPARVFHGSVDPALVNRLLNEMSSDPDQLPLLQHCLMRMWTKATNVKQQDQQQAQANGHTTITLDDYRDIDALGEALSTHADEVLQSLTTEQQRIAQTLFRRLTERVAGRGDRRRPSKLRDIAEVAGVSDEDVAAVVKEFRRSDRSFLTPPPEVRLTADTFLDITHESLITLWHTLTGWVDDEARSAAAYDRLKKTAQDWPKDAELLGGVNLERALEWRNKQQPTVFWARRYGTDEEFAQTIKFLDASEKAWRVHLVREADRERLARENEITRNTLTAKAKFARKLKFLTTALALVAILAVVAAAFAFSQSKAANQQRFLAEKNLEEAKTQRVEAETQKNLATLAASEASRQSKFAEDNRKDAIAKAELASRRERDARRAEADALKAQAESEIAKKAAIKDKETALQLAAELEIARKAQAVEDDKYARSVEAERDSLLQEKEKTEEALRVANENRILADRAQTELNVELKNRLFRTERALNTQTAFSADATKILTFSTGQAPSVWDTLKNSTVKTLRFGSDFLSAALSRDGTRVATASKTGDIVLTDVTSGTELHRFQGIAAKPTKVVFSGDAKRLAVLDTESGVARVIDVGSGTVLAQVGETSNPIVNMSFSEDGRQLAVTELDGESKLLQIRPGQQPLVGSLTPGGCRPAAFDLMNFSPRPDLRAKLTFRVDCRPGDKKETDQAIQNTSKKNGESIKTPPEQSQLATESVYFTIQSRQDNGNFVPLADFHEEIDRPSGRGEISSFLEKLKFKGIPDETIRKISALIIEGADKMLAETGADPTEKSAKQIAIARDLFKKIMDELDIND